MTIGIYRIYNINNNNSYIGQSKSIESRWLQHKEDLRNNKHHQFYLQKEYNKSKKEVERQYKNMELYEYLDYDKLTIDKYYKIEILKEFDYYDLSNLLSLEDKYILEYRNTQEGYKQKTNKEIDGSDILKEVYKLMEIHKNKYPLYWEFMNDKFKRDLLIYEKLKEEYINNRITLNDMQNEIIKLTKEHYAEYVALYGELKEGDIN